MSDSKLKRNANALYSDSEQQTSDVEEDYVVEAPKKTKSSTKTSYKESKSRASKKLSKKSNDDLASSLFGATAETKAANRSATPLWSSLARRVPGGVLRQLEVHDTGDIFFDVKVYNTGEIENIEPINRANKWSAQLRLRVEPDDPLWEQLKRLCGEAKKRFKKEAIFYPDKQA